SGVESRPLGCVWTIVVLLPHVGLQDTRLQRQGIIGRGRVPPPTTVCNCASDSSSPSTGAGWHGLGPIFSGVETRSLGCVRAIACVLPQVMPWNIIFQRQG